MKLNKYAKPDEIIEKLGPITEKGHDNEEMLRNIKTTFEYSSKTMSPYYLDKLYTGSDPIGQISELMVAMLNTNVHVYHAAPVFSVMETLGIKELGKGFGFPQDKLEGILVAGGSSANLCANLLARHKYFPDVRDNGWAPEDKPVVFAPAQTHYSSTRAAAIAGIGLNGVIKVPCSGKTGQMDVEALEKSVVEAISQGKKPY